MVNIVQSIEKTLRVRLIAEIKGGAGRIRVIMRGDAPIRVEGIPEALAICKGDLTFSPTGTPEFLYRYKTESLVELETANLLKKTEYLISEAFAPLLASS